MPKEPVSPHEAAIAKAAESLWAAMGGSEEGWKRLTMSSKARYRRYVAPAIQTYLDMREEIK